MSFSNLNIRDQMSEPQHRTPAPPLLSFLQAPPTVPLQPDFPKVHCEVYLNHLFVPTPSKFQR